VRDLAQTTNAAGITELKRVAASRGEPVELRCEAVAALAGDPALLMLLNDPAPAVRLEAARSLRPMATDERVRIVFAAMLKRMDPTPASEALRETLAHTLELAATNSGGTGPASRPASDDEWRKALKPSGDAASGRRVFFSPTFGCARCHRIEDRGGRLGPDLSVLARGANREKIMQSILHPSRDIAPQFVSHTVETKDGESVTGLLNSEGADGTVTLLTAEGKAVRIPGAQIASRTQSKVSLMPEGLDRAMTVGEFLDLMAFLLSRK